MHPREAVVAHGKARNLDQRRGADATVGGKQNGKKTLGGSVRPGEGEAVTRTWRGIKGLCLGSTGLASPDSVLTTAEDGLPCARQLPVANGPTLRGTTKYNGEKYR